MCFAPLLPVRERALDRIPQEHHDDGVRHELRRARRCERVVDVVRRGVDRNRLDPDRFRSRARVDVEGKKERYQRSPRQKFSDRKYMPFMFSAVGKLPHHAGVLLRGTATARSFRHASPRRSGDRVRAAPTPDAMPAPRGASTSPRRAPPGPRPVAPRHPTLLSLPRFGDGGGGAGGESSPSCCARRATAEATTDDHDLREQPVDRRLHDEHDDRDVGPERDGIRAHGPRIRACRPSTRAAGRTRGSRTTPSRTTPGRGCRLPSTDRRRRSAHPNR